MKYQKPDHVQFRAVQDEVVILDSRADAYYGLNPMAAVVWQSLAEGQTADHAVNELIKHFSVERDDAQADVKKLIDEFVSLRLFLPASS